MEHFRRGARLSWVLSGALGLLCCGLAAVQYRWTGEISDAEKIRLREDLGTRLNQISHTFDRELTAACLELVPAAAEIEARGREAAYAARYVEWRRSHERILERYALAIPEEGEIRLEELDLELGRFAMAEWPQNWNGMREFLAARLARQPLPASRPWREATLFEIPRFGPEGEAEWLLIQLNGDYLRDTLLPDLIRRFLGTNYQWDIGEAGVASAGGAADGAANLLTLALGPAGPAIGGARWELRGRDRSGSLEALVARARRRNLAVSAAILLLIVGSVWTLVRSSRQSQQLAELQMNFVAGVSHELRTPLTVIRTAAYNLRGRIAERPDQVERYGQLIQQESEKLTALVEQALRFAGAKAGRVIQQREAASVEELIDQALRGSRLSAQEGRLVIERRIGTGLPPVYADALALSHAIQNLLDNALKYGTESSNWVGISAAEAQSEKGTMVEIRIADRGPGIPPDEQRQIFRPFFRGRRALEDQAPGTGLGLNLVKMIIEAHEGTIEVKSAPGEGTEFIMRIPAAAPEPDYEFSHSAD